MRRAILALLLLVFLPSHVSADWFQWGRTATHDSASPAIGKDLHRIELEMVLDPFADKEKADSGGSLIVHYQAPVVAGDDLFLVVKNGEYTGRGSYGSQIWNVRNVRLTASGAVTRWNYASNWKPVPFDVASWEPVYHLVLTADAVWAPAAGGAIDKLDRNDGRRIARFNPFGTITDSSIYTVGPPTADDAGNIYYNVIQLATSSPLVNDPQGSWLVRIGRDGTMTKATFESLTPNAPAAGDQCPFIFAPEQLPWPPTPDAVAPTRRCGPQRPGLNVAPAVAADGTIYTVSRAHLSNRDSFLVAVNPDLTPKWAASMRNRFNDGCNVLVPPTGTPGGCRTGAINGIDPADNRPGSGIVSDNSTSSPVVTPDNKILYGAVTGYNYGQGHLMKFSADGAYEATYPWGWDLTPAIVRHDGTYSILIKENHYNGGAYCGPGPRVPAGVCPTNRNANTPNDPEQYFIASLDPNLQVEWKFKNTETKSCGTQPDGTIQCTDDHPRGFEWCINAIAVDSRGVVYANAEDGYLYAIGPDGQLRQRIFLRLALGAAYTPLSIGDDGRIYTQNDGRLFVVNGPPKRRTSKRP